MTFPRRHNPQNLRVMSRFILTLALIASVAIAAQAQMKPVKLNAGDLEFSTGIGLVPTFAADKAQTVVPPISLRLDYYLSSNISIGGYAAFSSTTSQINRPNGTIDAYENDFYVAGIRSSANSNDLNHWRIYGGLMLGYTMPNVTKTSTIAEPKDGNNEASGPSFSREPRNQFIYSGYIGARRYFSPKMAGFAELGYGVSLFNIGLTIKL